MTDGPAEAVQLRLRTRAHPPRLDAAAADALAVVTLLTSGDAGDLDRAGAIITELLAEPDGPNHLVSGLSSVCATLLVLLEFHGVLGLNDALGQVGRLIAQASVP